MEKILSKTSKDLVNQLLQSIDVTVNGNNPWDIQINNPKFYTRVVREGALGLGEAYMDNWWNCERLDVFFDRLLRAKIDGKIKVPFRFVMKSILAKFFNFQSKLLAREVAHKHYDLGNSLFQNMLDSRMIYSCGYWKSATTLEEAQIAKLELICQKLQLRPGLTLLDIGCGWGGLAKYASEKYGVQVVGVTISKQQQEFAKQHCAGLPIDIRLQDYRDLSEKFDRVVSVGMFEHVGHLNYKIYMQTVHNVLSDSGLFLLHTIGSNETTSFPNEWIMKYIFPNGMLPSIKQISEASEKLFIMEDWHNFGADYDKTLIAWYDNFIKNWDKIKSSYYDERFYRMWTYYLLACAGNFRARSSQLWQVIFSKHGVQEGYICPR
ncbi:MAG TPA: cyclopropane fatty acyl phospholipid synthase [Gammaproteobacteria bacterium]|jgi:cyclopropane-fatty-acyl-phospholipid synthase|nr:cyclopropane fatty acyl phospholipid synthase [Gammaproteobacteria bacterium]